MTLTLIIGAIFAFIALAYMGKGFAAWLTASVLGLIAWSEAGIHSPELFKVTVALVATFAVVFGVPALRRALISGTIMGLVAKTLPKIGETEDIALKAGTVGWEGEIFSGQPNWKKLLQTKIKPLSKEEKAFLDGPVEEFCRLIDDEKIAQERDLPKTAWDFIKKHKFFGMIIPKKEGGLGFSAAAHSAVVAKIASRSVAAAVIVMVPNSLGPGELLMRYGTAEQKKKYLKKLAEGKEIPCFALTEPHAGSDAANGRSFGTVVKKKIGTKTVVGINLTFDKRYITLAPVATVVGLAFKLYDPNHILGKEDEIGITCALLPRDTKGMKIGNRHDPMGVPFPNGPIRGKDVFIPLDYVIGGKKGVGEGWRMLMEALAAGRGISLPSLSVGAAQLSTSATTAYSVVRQQFGINIGRFEGVRERLSRIAGHTYFMNATRLFTSGAVDGGEHPSVGSAIAKAYLTEGMRLSLNDAMDVFGGAAICRGPNNIFCRPYTSIPIGITVEGANILTRSLIVFGQGAIRCHPFVLDEVNAVQKGNLKKFDVAFFGHLNHITKNVCRTFVLALGSTMAEPPVKGPESKYYRDLDRLSAGFALTADLALATLGGGLKSKEHISGRFADVLAWMYIASATLKKFHDDGAKETDRPALEWAMTKALFEAETALDGVLTNLPNRFAAGFARALVFPFGTRLKPVNDKQIEHLATALLDEKTGLRTRLTTDICHPKASSSGMGKLEEAYAQTVATLPLQKKLFAAIKAGKLEKGLMSTMVPAAQKAKIITATEGKKLLAADSLMDEIIQVADFTPDAYKKLK